MSNIRTGLRFALVAALVAAPGAASAQSSTGIDMTWMVTYGAAGAYGTPFTAPVVTINPGWTPNTSSYKWIGADADGTIDDQYSDGRPAYDYLFSTKFTLPTATTITFSCAMDNSLGEIILNHDAPIAGGCGTFFLGGDQTMTLAAGVNRLTFHVQGDGTTDGLLVNIKSAVTATPEPASLTLLATGLVGIFGAARRRRKLQQG